MYIINHWAMLSFFYRTLRIWRILKALHFESFPMMLRWGDISHLRWWVVVVVTVLVFFWKVTESIVVLIQLKAIINKNIFFKLLNFKKLHLKKLTSTSPIISLVETVVSIRRMLPWWMSTSSFTSWNLLSRKTMGIGAIPANIIATAMYNTQSG